MISPVSVRFSNYYGVNFQWTNQDLKNFETEKEGMQKYLTSKNVMLGLSAIGLVTLGIIGHKNGWFSKGVKNLLKKSSAGEQINMQKLNTIIEFDENNKYIKEVDAKTNFLIKNTVYQKGSNVIISISEYDDKTGNIIKRINYQKGNNTIESVSEFDSKTGKVIKDTSYQEDGKTIQKIIDCDSQTGKLIKVTTYESDGVTIKSIETFD